MISLRVLAATLALLAPMGAVGCGGEETPAARPVEGRYDSTGRLLSGTRRLTALPNVILISIDTVRGDSIESAGGAPPPCPNLAKFASQCAKVSNASSSAGWTAPSTTTLLTGLWPSKHGVRGTLTAAPLVPAVTTLAEYLKSAGYSTEAMTGGGWVSPEIGHVQGFDRFTSNWSFIDDDDHLARWTRAWDRRRPFFLFLHTYDAHDPYGRKRPFDGADDPKRVEECQQFVARMKAHAGDAGGTFPHEDERELMLAWRGDPLMHHYLEGAFGDNRVQSAIFHYDVDAFPTAPDRHEVEDQLRAKYRAGLQQTDTLFANVMKIIESADLPVNTLKIVVSDHGESFGEHDNLGHGRWLYREITHVMMMANWPGHLAPRAIDASAGLVDVVPTILDACGLPPAVGLDGTTLLPILEGKDAVGHPVRAEDTRFAKGEGGRVVLRVTSVRDAHAVWISTWDPRTGQATEEIFDRASDPTEQRALPAETASRYGPAFEAEVGRAREAVSKFKTEGTTTDTPKGTGG